LTCGGSRWLSTLRAYVALSLGLHLLWEAAQLPLYAIWDAGALAAKVFAVVHCALGDVLIAGLALLGALVVTGSEAWPAHRARAVWATALGFGVAYTMYSEWLNTMVRQSWTYSSLMPVLPLFGTGLSPLVQWLVVPSLALTFATRRHRL
jgi:hypothetical protein